jgi:hypothetical protein
MSRPLYSPSPGQKLWLAAVTALAVGYAAYMRYSLIENSTIGLACEGGAVTFVCASRRLAIALFTPSAFGGVAVAAAVLNLVRPSVVLCTVALVAAGLGLVLYNAALAALAVALLILSLARPAPEPE